MKFEELVDATAVAARQIRYLIAEGFVPPPVGGRARAFYNEDHVTAVRRYDGLRGLGFPPAAIRLLLDAKAGVPVPIIPGLTLIIAPELIGAGGDAEHVAAQASAKIVELLNKETPDVVKSRLG